MNELELATLKRTAERQLKREGRTNREARMEVGRMTVAELEWYARPPLLKRVSARLFG